MSNKNTESDKTIDKATDKSINKATNTKALATEPTMKSDTSTDAANIDSKDKPEQSAADKKTVAEESKPASQQSNDASEDVAYKPVDIMIGGKTYTINCPVDEVGELKQASSYLHNFIQDMRRQSPKLSYENLLVLCCLNLYETAQQAKKTDDEYRDTNEKAKSLIDKIIADTRSILG